MAAVLLRPVLFGPMSDELYMRDVLHFLRNNNPTRADFVM
jgi:hypothetical protein